MADHLSRLDPFVRQPTNDGAIHETFPNEHLLGVAILPRAPWYAGIVNYLSCKAFPPKFKFQEKKRFMVEAKQYFGDDRYLYKVCGDDVVRRCVPYEEVSFILQHCHCSEPGATMVP